MDIGTDTDTDMSGVTRGQFVVKVSYTQLLGEGTRFRQYDIRLVAKSGTPMSFLVTI